MKEIGDDTNKWKDVPLHGLEELMLLKYLPYPKESVDSMQTL